MFRFYAAALALLAVAPAFTLASNTALGVNLEDVCWEDLDPNTRAAAIALGYDDERWEAVDFFATVPWSRLTEERKAEAEAEGYNEASWNLESGDDDADAEKLRRLNALIDQEAFATILDECWFEEYELTMLVETEKIHLDLIAVPADTNKEGCKDALTFDDFGVGIKLASFADDLDLADDWQSDSLPLGVFSLGDISDATDDADLLDPDEYDVVTNNCATFVLDIMWDLQIPVTKEIKRYVVKNLASNSKFVDEVRKNPHAIELIGPEDLVDPSKTLTDLEVVRKLVSHYVNVYAANDKTGAGGSGLLQTTAHQQQQDKARAIAQQKQKQKLHG